MLNLSTCYMARALMAGWHARGERLNPKPQPETHFRVFLATEELTTVHRGFGGLPARPSERRVLGFKGLRGWSP